MSSVHRVAAIDCGTNTIRLLIADLDTDTGDAVQVDRRSTIVRLGQGVDRTGKFAPEALTRTFAATDTYAEAIEAAGVEAVRFVATSAARDVSNRGEFLAGCEKRVGVRPEVISGDEEARLTYDGATRQMVGRDDVHRPILVVDIGGGSTELVLGEHGVSLDVGSVRLTERHELSDPPTADQIAAVVGDVETALATVELPIGTAATMVAVAGSATTMAAMVLGLGRYDRERVNLCRLPRADLERDVERVVAMSIEQRRALDFMQPDRADVIGAGALVLRTVMRRVGVDEVLVSARDILDGIAWSILR
jgi:exopolyphosphatase/guanosine-5'-triphosphate,3'-diphosphate pyrophosphatase